MFGSKDIALLQFASDRIYERGKLEQSLSEGDPVWAVGYPINEQGYGDDDGFVTFDGKVLLQLDKPF
ncbi:MAG: hypothetical protein GDA44_02565 [Prochloron sp. SP5CPC1]|nr:hypothetical protein [Candidatus Paraprochloron terpiosi SP5CPC1]